MLQVYSKNDPAMQLMQKSQLCFDQLLAVRLFVLNMRHWIMFLSFIVIYRPLENHILYNYYSL